MDIWIIRDGEKAGPFHDFEIRRKISNGELEASVPAWHEGLAEWKPLDQIPLFRGEFHQDPVPLSLPEDASLKPVTEPQTPPLRPIYIRRFFARWFDLHLYSAAWWLILWAGGVDIGVAWMNPVLLLVQFIPWFAIESVLIHKFGTTPGKWLLRIRVANIDASLLSSSASTRRAIRVMLAGIGLGWGILTLFCQAFSYIMAKRLGNALWDQSGGHRVFPEKLKPFRTAAFIGLFYVVIQLQMMVLSPYIMERFGEQFPEIKAAMEKEKPWHLPKRH